MITAEMFVLSWCSSSGPWFGGEVEDDLLWVSEVAELGSRGTACISVTTDMHPLLQCDRLCELEIIESLTYTGTGGAPTPMQQCSGLRGCMHGQTCGIMEIEEPLLQGNYRYKPADMYLQGLP